MPTQLKNRHGVREWYAVLKIDGKRKHTKCESRDEATVLEATHRIEAEMRCLTPKVVKLNGLLVNYLAAVEGRKIANASVKEKALVFHEFALAIGKDRPVKSITYGEVERFLMGIANRVSGNRANRYRVHILAAYNWGIKAMGLSHEKPWEVERFREERSPRYVPPVEDFWKVVDAAGNDPDPQAQRLILLYLHTSARKSEVFNLKWSDVDFKARKLTLWTRKRSGGLECDTMPFTQEIEAILVDQRRHVELRSEYVFVCPVTGTRFNEHGKLMHRLCEQVGCKSFGFHAIRHLSASMMDEANMPLRVVQSQLRHQNATVTSRYLHSLGSRESKLDGVFARENKKAALR